MKHVPTEFRKNRMDFKQIERNEHVALYEETSGGTTTYEVHVIRRHKNDRLIDGRVVSATGDEYLPSNSDWGRLAWTYMTKAEAMSRYAQKTMGFEALASKLSSDVSEVTSEPEALHGASS